MGGGGGADAVYCGNRPNLYIYNAGDSNDVIYNFSTTDTLNISGSAYSTLKSGKDVIVTVSNGKIMLKNTAGLSSVNIAGTEEPKWTLNGTTATYSTTENTLFTLTGVKNTTGITVDTTKKVVTLTASNLDKKNVTVDSDHTLKLTSDVNTTKEDISKGTMLKGGKGTSTISSSTVKLTVGNFKSNVTLKSNAGGYKVSLSGNFKGKTFNATSGKDSIDSNGKKITIAVGKGNDFVTLGNSSTFYYAKGDGNDTLYNFSSTDGGKITVKNAAQGSSVKVVNSKDKVISNYTYTTSGIADGK